MQVILKGSGFVFLNKHKEGLPLPQHYSLCNKATLSSVLSVPQVPNLYVRMLIPYWLLVGITWMNRCKVLWIVSGTQQQWFKNQLFFFLHFILYNSEMGIADNLHISCLCDMEHNIASALPEVAPVTVRWEWCHWYFLNLAPDIRMGKNLLETLFF